MAKKNSISGPKLTERNSFKAGGKEYFIETPEQLGIDRKRQFDQCLTKIAFGQGPTALISNLLQIKAAFNKSELAEVGHLITTQLSTATKIHERSDATIEACAIFINLKDEDRTKPPEDADVRGKIEDWNNAGLSYAFFMKCAGTFSAMLKALYESSTPSSPVVGNINEQAAAS